MATDSNYSSNNAQSDSNRTKKNRNLTNDLSAIFTGKLQPQALELEQAVIGALMLDRDALSSVMDLLKPESFYLEAHQLVYEAVLSLFRASKPIDMLTVGEELRRMGQLEKVGGPYFLVELTHRVASTANIEYHARIVAQKFIQRELIRASTDVIREAYDETTDVFALMDKAEQHLFAITETNLSRSFQGMNSLSSEMLKHLETLSAKEDGLTGVPSGFTPLDRITSGFQMSDLIIMAARPAMGKTACVLSIARNAAMDFDKGVAFFSLEMSSLQLMQRILSGEAEVPNEKLRNGKMESHEWQAVHKAIERLSKAPIFIDDTPGINIFELRAKCRRLKAQHNIQLIIIDYLQLMTAGADNARGGNREQEISSISRGLKGLAKELNVPVIALSQLSRAVETRGGSKKPQLSDLRESGAIEQDADIVTFIYRPDYYQILEDDNGNSTKGMADIIVAKHRNGALGEARVRFVGEYSRFVDVDDNSFDLSRLETPTADTNTITLGSRMNEADIPF
jgi:replicative DNA helicase